MKWATVLLMFLMPVCGTDTEETQPTVEINFETGERAVLREQLSLVYQEINKLKSEQAMLKQYQEATRQGLLYRAGVKNESYFDTENSLIPSASFEDRASPEKQECFDTLPSVDPCRYYTKLDQSWRSTNFSSKIIRCDQSYKWRGWYRLFIDGASVQMPERCVPKNRCGTHAPLWLTRPHPSLKDGVVTREVCGHWTSGCCAYKSSPIQVKACPGNYYVYKFVKPTLCSLAYCADVNTIVCGKCKKGEKCVSRDKVNWRCKERARKTAVHFFATYPSMLSGTHSRIKYSNIILNIGNGYNKRSGVFTVPVKGVYQFFFSSQNNLKSKKTDLWLVIDGKSVALSHTQVKKKFSVGNLSTYMTYLRRGAKVYVSQNSGKTWASYNSCTISFGGSLLLRQ